MSPHVQVIDLGSLCYADAYAQQIAHHEQVLAARLSGDDSTTADRPAGDPGRVLLVEHDPPVITVSRRQGAESHLLASRDRLAELGIQVQETDRGGDITYHGPGQLVVYPILDLNVYRLRLHDYMRLLEQVVIDTLGDLGIQGRRDPGATGVWVGDPDGPAAKICAMGVRIRRWVSMHGLALNITTNLDHFRLIVPCGLHDRSVTSIAKELGPQRCPSMAEAKKLLTGKLIAALGERLK